MAASEGLTGSSEKRNVDVAGENQGSPSDS
jgi:hypothetical protein